MRYQFESKPEITSDGLTLGAVREAIQQKPPNTRRARALAVLDRLGQVLGAPLDTIPADLNVIRAKLLVRWIHHNIRDLAGLLKSTRAAVSVSHVQVLSVARNTPASAEWLAVIEEKKSELRRFACYCSALAIAPSQVTDDTFAAFHAALKGRVKQSDAANRMAVATSTWNRIAQERPDLQPVEVFRADGRRTLVGPGDLAPSLWDDIEAHLERCREPGVDLAAPMPPVDPMRCTPIREPAAQTMRKQILAGVTAYRDGGGDLAKVMSLGDLTTPRAFTAIMAGLRAADLTLAYRRSILRVLIQAAVEHVKRSAEAIALLRQMAGTMGKLSPGLAQKHSDALEPFKNHDVLRALLALPSFLVAACESDDTTAKADVALGYWQTAIMILVLIQLAPEPRHLLGLRFGTSVRPSSSTPGGWTITIKSDDGNDLQCCEADAELAAMLTGYHQFLRRLVPEAGMLFVTTKGRQKAQITLNNLLNRLTEIHVGVVLTQRQYRYLVQRRYLEQHPGQFEQLRRMLGLRSSAMIRERFGQEGDRMSARRLAAGTQGMTHRIAR